MYQNQSTQQNCVIVCARIIIGRISHISENIKSYCDGTIVMFKGIYDDFNTNYQDPFYASLNNQNTKLGSISMDKYLDHSFKEEEGNALYKYFTELFCCTVERPHYMQGITKIFVGDSGLSVIVDKNSYNITTSNKDTTISILTPIGFINTYADNSTIVKEKDILSAARDFVKGNPQKLLNKIGIKDDSKFGFLKEKFQPLIDLLTSQNVSFNVFWEKLEKEKGVLQSLTQKSFEFDFDF